MLLLREENGLFLCFEVLGVVSHSNVQALLISQFTFSYFIWAVKSNSLALLRDSLHPIPQNTKKNREHYIIITIKVNKKILCIIISR